MIEQTFRRFKTAWVVLGGLAAAFILGLAVSRFGPPLFALLGAPVAGLLLYIRPEIGVYAITLSLPIEDLLPGIGNATGTRLLGMVVFGIWTARKIMLRESWRSILSLPLIQGALLLTGWIFISLLWAEERDAAILGLISQVQLVFLALIVIDLMQSWDRAAWVVRLLVFGGIIAAGFTIEQYFFEGIKRAGDGISGGINFTASSLVTTMPFAFFLIRSHTGGLWKILGLLFVPLGIVAVIVTFSRASYIFLVLALAVQTWLLLRTRSSQIWFLLMGGLMLSAFLFVPKEALNERVQTISPLLSDWLNSGESAGSQADVRAYHWLVGIEMLREAPLTGIGYNNYGEKFLSYQFEVQGTPEIFANPRSPHSSYIGILTELGLLGIGLFLFILVFTLFSLLRAARRLSTGQDINYVYLVQAVTTAWVLQILYGWVLNTHMNKNFWLILGLSMAFHRLVALMDQRSKKGKRYEELHPRRF